MNEIEWKNNYRVQVLVGLGVVIFLLLGYMFGIKPLLAEKDATTQTSMQLMDTIVDIRVDDRKSEKLVAETFQIMQDLEKTLSRFIEQSDVSRINENVGEWVKVSESTLEVIQLGMEMGERSQGTFDITVGAVLDLWGFGSGDHYVPNDAELEKTLVTVDYNKVEINMEEKQVRIPEGTVLDLGGIAKGYVVEQGIEFLRSKKVVRAIINAGGDISVIGRRPDDNPWRVGVQDPKKPTEIRWVLPLENTTVVTSGDYQRYFEHGGRRWHHIIDPRSGYPADDLHSVTIVGENAAICDAISTAVFVLGWEKGIEFMERSADVEGILVGSDDVWISPGLAKVILTQ